MSDDDRKKAEDQDALTKLQEQVDALTKDKDQLLKDKIISEYTANYLAQGFAKELAEETAKALADGDMDKVFKNQAKHNESLEAKIKADLMKADPKPGGGSGGKETDVAVEKAKELAKARFGNDKSYNDIMSKYKK